MKMIDVRDVEVSILKNGVPISQHEFGRLPKEDRNILRAQGRTNNFEAKIKTKNFILKGKWDAHAPFVYFSLMEKHSIDSEIVEKISVEEEGNVVLLAAVSNFSNERDPYLFLQTAIPNGFDKERRLELILSIFYYVEKLFRLGFNFQDDHGHVVIGPKMILDDAPFTQDELEILSNHFHAFSKENERWTLNIHNFQMYNNLVLGVDTIHREFKDLEEEKDNNSDGKIDTSSHRTLLAGYENYMNKLNNSPPGQPDSDQNRFGPLGLRL